MSKSTLHTSVPTPTPYASIVLGVDVFLETDPGIDTPNARELPYDYLVVRDVYHKSVKMLGNPHLVVYIDQGGSKILDPDEIIVSAVGDALVNSTAASTHDTTPQRFYHHLLVIDNGLCEENRLFLTENALAEYLMRSIEDGDYGDDMVTDYWRLIREQDEEAMQADYPENPGRDPGLPEPSDRLDGLDDMLSSNNVSIYVSRHELPTRDTARIKLGSRHNHDGLDVDGLINDGIGYALLSCDPDRNEKLPDVSE